MFLMNAEEKVWSENIFHLIKNEKIPVNTIKNLESIEKKKSVFLKHIFSFLSY